MASAAPTSRTACSEIAGVAAHLGETLEEVGHTQTYPDMGPAMARPS